MKKEEKIRIIKEEIKKHYLKNNDFYHFDNCYAYAINSTYRDHDDDFIYNLGNMSNDFYPPQNIEEAKKALIYDMQELNIECTECNLNEKLDDNEWKIALFYDAFFEDSTDFHVVKQNPDGSWSHKEGLNGKITYLGKINPQYLNVDLEFVGFFKLKPKQRKR